MENTPAMASILATASPLFTLIIIGVLIVSVIFAMIGVWLCHRGLTGATEITILGQKIKTVSIGIVAVFLGAVIIILCVREVLGTFKEVAGFQAPAKQVDSPARKFDDGLRLLKTTYYEINNQRMSGVGMMVVPATIKVPSSTKAVHVAVNTVSFGTGDQPISDSLSQIAYEITNRDYSNLQNGQFKFDFKAVLKGSKQDLPWTGYFVLEILCFG